MLIYNYKKEFLGIDEADLEAIGFANLEELRAEAGDIADLFVKTPGYVYNFEHIHWIDFIQTSTTNTSPQAVIHTNDRNYICSIEIKQMYLVDNPSTPAYHIYLNNIRVLREDEKNLFYNDITNMPAPTPNPSVVELQTVPSSVSAPTNASIPSQPKAKPVTKPVVEPTVKPIVKEVKETPKQEVKVNDIPLDTPLEIDLDLDDEVVETPAPMPEPAIQPEVEEEPMLELDDLVFDDEVKATSTPAPAPTNSSTPSINPELKEKILNYKYNPNVACDKLGLPLELIEEFTEDFIAQAHEFKDGLYSALSVQDIDEIKSLSHKLKGVAANLHIEDAYDVLVTINTSKDIGVMEENINALYIIIDKLEGKEIFTNDTVSAPQIEEPLMEEPLMMMDEPSIEETIKEDVKEKEAPKADESSLEDDLDLLDFDDMMMDETPEEAPKETVKSEPKIEISEDDDDDFSLDLADLSFDDDTPKEIHYNKEKVAGEIGLDIDTFNELVQDYVDDYKTICSQIDDAIANNNLNGIKSNIQKLKTMSENMKMEDAISELDLILSQTNIETIKSHVENIKNFVSTKLEG